MLKNKSWTPSTKKGHKVFCKSKRFKLNMTDWPWLQKELVWPINKTDVGVGYHFLCTNLGDKILCTYYQTIIFMGVYQRWATHALKPKSVVEMHFRENSKKTQSLRKKGCRQKCLDKSLIYVTYLLLLTVQLSFWGTKKKYKNNFC